MKKIILFFTFFFNFIAFSAQQKSLSEPTTSKANGQSTAVVVSMPQSQTQLQNMSSSSKTSGESTALVVSTPQSQNMNAFSAMAQAVFKFNALQTPTIEAVRDYLIKGGRVSSDKLFQFGDNNIMALFDAGVKHNQEKEATKFQLFALMYLTQLFDKVGKLNAILNKNKDDISRVDKQLSDNNKEFRQVHHSLGNLDGQSQQYQEGFRKVDANLTTLHTRMYEIFLKIGRIDGDIAKYAGDIKANKDSISKLQSTILGALSLDNFNQFIKKLQILALIGFPALKLSNKFFDKVPVINILTNALESTFLKIILVSVIWELTTSKSIGKIINFESYKKEKATIAAIIAIIGALKLKSILASK